SLSTPRRRRLPRPCSQGVGRAGAGDHGLLKGPRVAGSTFRGYQRANLEISSRTSRIAALQKRWGLASRRGTQGTLMLLIGRSAFDVHAAASTGDTNRGKCTSSSRSRESPAPNTDSPGTCLTHGSAGRADRLLMWPGSPRRFRASPCVLRLPWRPSL